MELKISLKLHILNKTLKLSLCQLFIKWNFLKCPFDDFPLRLSNRISKNVDQLKSTDLKEKVKEMIISFKESQNKIFVQMIIKSFLPDWAFNNILRQEIVFNLMTYLISSTEKPDSYLEFVFEHVMWRVEVILEILNFSEFKA